MGIYEDIESVLYMAGTAGMSDISVIKRVEEWLNSTSCPLVAAMELEEDEEI